MPPPAPPAICPRQLPTWLACFQKCGCLESNGVAPGAFRRSPALGGRKAWEGRGRLGGPGPRSWPRTHRGEGMATEGFLQALPDTTSSSGGTESKGHGFMPRPHAFLPSILWGLKILSSPQECRACSTRGNPQNCGFTGSQGGVGRARSSAAPMLIPPTAAGAPEPQQSRPPSHVSPPDLP